VTDDAIESIYPKGSNIGLIMYNGSMMRVSVEDIKLDDLLIVSNTGHKHKNTNSKITLTGKLAMLYSEDEMDDVLDQMGRQASIPDDYEELQKENRNLNEELANIKKRNSMLIT
jgi:hypothetical protein